MRHLVRARQRTVTAVLPHQANSRVLVPKRRVYQPIEDAATLAGWWRRGLGITVAGALPGVSNWADYSGNSRHLVQAVDASRPAYLADGSIVFDGVDDFLRVAFTLIQPASVYFLFKQITAVNGDAVISGAATACRATQAAAPPHLAYNAGAILQFNGEAALGTWQAAGFVANGVNSVLAMHGEAEVTGDGGANGLGGITLAALTAGASAWGNVAFREVVAFSGAHDAAKRAQVLAYLNSKGTEA